MKKQNGERLNMTTEAGAAAADAGDQKTETPPTDAGDPGTTKNTGKSDEGTGTGDNKGASASGDEGTGGKSDSDDGGGKGETKTYWPEDWREQIAKHASAGNEKAYERELKRLQRVTNPEAIYGNYREAEAKISSNKAIFKPGKDATEDEIKAYRKALGVPETAEDYVKNISLPQEQTLGDDDKEMALDFAKGMHEIGAPQNVVDKALSWYYAQQENAAALQDDADEYQKYEAEKELKEEYGAAYKRKTAAIASIFAETPGGADVSNPDSLYSRLIGGRLADGTLIGNDPDVVRWLVAIAGDVNPAAQALPDGMGSQKSVEDEIKEIEKIMKTDKREYFKNHANRYSELLSIRERMKAKG